MVWLKIKTELVRRTLGVSLLLCYLIQDGVGIFTFKFRDQQAKIVSQTEYYEGLRKFYGESISTLSFSNNRRTLYIGAKNCFHILNLTAPFGDTLYIQNRTWTPSQVKMDNCLLKGEQEWECQNYIQVIEFNEKNNRLLICGTDAQAPSCLNYYDNSLTRNQSLAGMLKCPFSPTQQSTAIFADGALYTATVSDYSGRDSVIYRSMSDTSQTNLRSNELDSKWLKIPSFINSFHIDDWVMLFFREVAVEHVNSGEAIYSRVAKVCKSDEGGDWVSEEKWTTYQKARLNCSFPGAFPFYFNYLQDVTLFGVGQNRMFYGVFTTGQHEIPGSAICVFSLKKIKEIFNDGQFKAQTGGNWFALPKDMIPQPRPGNCSLNSRQQPDTNLNFISNHPLMDDSVPNFGDPNPIFDLTRADFRLTQIVVHQKKIKTGEDITVMFLGSEDGRLLKVSLLPDTEESDSEEEGKVQSNLLEEIFVSPRDMPEIIKQLEIVITVLDGVSREVILVGTNSTVVELPLQRCSNITRSCVCKQDPYCAWNRISEKCVEHIYGKNDYDEQDVANIQECPEEEIPEPTPTSSECLCPTCPPVLDWTTDALSYTTPGSGQSPPTRSTQAYWEPSTTAVASSTLKSSTSGPGHLSTGVPSKTEGNKIPDVNKPGGDPDTTPNDKIDNLIPDISQSRSEQTSLEIGLVVLLVAGWAAFMICIPIIIFLLIRNKRKGNYHTAATHDDYHPPPVQIFKQPKQSTDDHLLPPVSALPPYLHLSPPASPESSSTDPPLDRPHSSSSSSESQYPPQNPLRTATLDRKSTLGNHTHSLSRTKPPPPPVAPRRSTSSFNYGNDAIKSPVNGVKYSPRGQPNGRVHSPRGSTPSSPTKKRLNSTSSDIDRDSPMYRPPSIADERRRRPSGASFTDLAAEMNGVWLRNATPREESV